MPRCSRFVEAVRLSPRQSCGEHRKRERRPDGHPLRVVAGIRTVVEHVRALDELGEAVGVGRVGRDVLDVDDARVRSRPGHDEDVRPALGQVGSDRTPDGTSSDNDVPVRHRTSRP